jgi:hypothetical protein
VLSLYCSSLGAQSCRGAYKPSSSEGMVLYLSYVWWIPPFILQGATPYYRALLLACLVCSPWLTLRPCQLGSPTPSVGSGGSCSGQSSWTKGLRPPVLNLVGRDGLCASVGVQRSPSRLFVRTCSVRPPERALTGEWHAC